MTTEDRDTCVSLLERAGVGPRTVRACWNDASVRLAADVACEVMPAYRDARWFEDYIASGGSRAAAAARMSGAPGPAREPGADPLVAVYPDAPPGDRLLMHWVDQTLTVAAKFTPGVGSLPPADVAERVVLNADEIKDRVRGNRGPGVAVTAEDRRLMIVAALRRALAWVDRPASAATAAAGGGE